MLRRPCPAVACSISVGKLQSPESSGALLKFRKEQESNFHGPRRRIGIREQVERL